MRFKIAGIAFVLALLAVFAATLSTGTDSASADPPDGKNPVKEISEEIRNAGRNANFAENELPPPARGDDNRFPPRKGDHRLFVALDDTTGAFYLKEFELRAFDSTAEIWIASGPRALDGIVGLNFPNGDCRNDGVRNVVTDAQAQYLLGEFTNNIRPTDTDWFGEPIKRTGVNSQIQQQTSRQINSNAYRNNAGRDIVLVDNVRDDNFYDEDNDNSLPYIAGFFTTAMSFFFDRNVMTIDGFDWLHRTTANPANESNTDPCLNRPARPFLYESVFAHEYQHLIHADYDADEVNWVNEGMSDLAEILTGYSDPSLHVDELGHDSHTQSFLGWLTVAHPLFNAIARPAGPENSLTNWGDQGDLEILADYGFAYYFMTYLQGLGYDQAFFTDWHHNTANGIDGLNSALADAGTGDTFESIFNDIVVSALADAYLDGGASVGGAAGAYGNPAANATLFFSSDAYNTTGAPPWGSDYIPLAGDKPLDSIAFNGAGTFEFPDDPQWVVDGNGYFTNPDGSGGNYEPNQDLSITHEVTVGGSGGTLTFDHYYVTEDQWDFGFVQVSSDGGATWTSLDCTGTTTSHDPGAIASIVAELPGYTGAAGTAAAPVAATCAVPAGTQLIAFRLMTDPAVELDGWHVKNIELDNAPVGTPGSLAGWKNQKFFDPLTLDFYVQVVGLNGDVDSYGHVTSATGIHVVRLELDEANDGAVSEADIAILNGFDQVVVIVSGIPENEDITQYSPYSLLVDGAEKADGQNLVTGTTNGGGGGGGGRGGGGGKYK